MKLFRFVTKSFIFLFISFVVCMIGLYSYAYFSPKLELATANQYAFYDSSDNLVYQGSSTNEWIGIDNISQYVIDAIVSVEDKNFFRHQGFDYLRIAKSMFNNIKSGEIVQGASTITMQYARNLYLDFDQTWKRKIEESFLTLEIEVHYSKNEILEGYLNTINFGQGNVGIENASKYYFNKSSSELNLEEAIILAGIPKNPTNYNPQYSYENAVTRGRIVALSMLNNDKISKIEYDELFENPLDIYAKREKNNLQTLMYYQDAVMEELKKISGIPNSLIETGGLKIYTNLDVEAQTYLEDSTLKNMKNAGDLQVSGIMVNPNNGGIMALIGGLDYSQSQYNRATRSIRQVGSTMKPILYYAALENGFTSSSRFESKPTTFTFAENKNYNPANYNDKYGYQPITMAAALSYSDNIYAVKTHLFLGENTLVNISKRMGINGNLQANPSLPLGTSELSMLDFATGYTTLASGGYKRDLQFIRRVEDASGNIIYQAKDQNELVLNPNYAYILNEMMTSTYNSSFIDYNTPSLINVASKISTKYAIKTGSTGTDFWVVGYNPDLLTIIWNGYDDNSAVQVSEGSISRNIWLDTTEKYLQEKEKHWYLLPENVVGVPLHSITGIPTTDSKHTSVFYYVKGSENTITVDFFNEKSSE